MSTAIAAKSPFTRRTALPSASWPTRREMLLTLASRSLWICILNAGIPFNGGIANLRYLWHSITRHGVHETTNDSHRARSRCPRCHPLLLDGRRILPGLLRPDHEGAGGKRSVHENFRRISLRITERTV